VARNVIDFSIAISHFQAPPAVLDAVRAGLELPSLPYTAVGATPASAPASPPRW